MSRIEALNKLAEQDAKIVSQAQTDLALAELCRGKEIPSDLDIGRQISTWPGTLVVFLTAELGSSSLSGHSFSKKKHIVIKTLAGVQI